MFRSILLWLCFQIASAQTTHGELYLLDHSGSRHHLANISSHNASNYQIIDVNDSLIEGTYTICATLDNYNSCFGYSSIVYPLSYELEVFLANDRLSRLSFKSSTSTIGIIPVVKHIPKGPIPELAKLKRTTKTYESKRKAEEKGVVSAETADSSEEQMSFIQKNWKYMFIGLVIYIMSRGSGTSQDK